MGAIRVVRGPMLGELVAISHHDILASALTLASAEPDLSHIILSDLSDEE